MSYTLNYNLIDNGTHYSVSGYTGDPIDVVIPNEYNGIPVTSIGDRAFYGCTSLKSVIIGNSVTSIGKTAFYSCDNLTGIEIPNSVTSIGYMAFRNCTSLTSVVIGDSVTSIGNYAFEYCYKLVEVINKSTHITVEKGGSSNGYVGCYALAVYNSGDTFTGTKLSNDNGYIIYTDSSEKILVSYNGQETNLILPNYITKINNYAFFGCTSLTSVTIGNSVTSINGSAFAYCNSLNTINIISKVPANLASTNAFTNVSPNIKFYCYSSALEAYKTATNWSTYEDKFIADDMRLTFVVSANAQKKYFASKEEVNTLLEINTVLKSQIAELQTTVNNLQEIVASMSPVTPEAISTIFNTEV